MKKLAIRPLIKLRKNSKILDIGSGNNCLDISTHLVDMMPDSNAERPGDLERPDHREFKVGTIEAIPYPDKYFDFVHAAHILEHSTDPAQAISEMIRVAPAGYIETPFGTTEQGSILGGNQVGWDFHRWYVWTFPEMDCLYLKPKTTANLFSYCQCESGKLFSDLLKYAKFQELDSVLPYHCKMTQFNWKKSIHYEIWNEHQQGHNDGAKKCNCMYSAFSHHAGKYFRSLLQIRRRRDFRHRFPQAYQLLTHGISAP